MKHQAVWYFHFSLLLINNTKSNFFKFKVGEGMCVLKLSISKNEVHFFKFELITIYTSKTFTLLLKKFFLFQTSSRSTFWCFKSKCIFWRLKPNHSAPESQKTLDGVSISNCQTSCWRALHFVFEILIFVKCQLYKYFSNFQIKTNGTFL